MILVAPGVLPPARLTRPCVSPGATLGVLGGGQLGRMFAYAARIMGYHVVVLDPDPHSPAAQFADVHLCAGYDDQAALLDLGKRCAAITTEFENVPARSLDMLAALSAVRPAAAVVAIAQDRITEKSYLAGQGFPVAPFAVVRTEQELRAALGNIPAPAILKRSRLGYDGKGQAPVTNLEHAVTAFHLWGDEPCVLEQRVALEKEISVIVARGADGETACFPVAENRHQDGILDVSIVPARISAALAQQASGMAIRLSERLQYCGVLAVEFFVLADDRLLINEIAPRPHNSGHATLDACVTSQFEQQVRTLCGLPLGSTRLLSPAVMVNLLGHLWADGEPHWGELFQHPQAKLHLYGKGEPRPGRKMGHFTCLDESIEQALAAALEIKARLLKRAATSAHTKESA
ncbi:MAG: 5-(carboxyamino)imidazole ribonucleotide synthase [Gammaproteobacteria bacterium]|nr:5-(carboxyamino)imidazole ribonucleotide synthase [Gammaproteobacteria bacterium]